jgi:hypothetical protein
LGEELPRGLTVGRLEPNRDVENLETDFFRRAEEIPGRRPAVVVFAEVEHEDEIVVKANIWNWTIVAMNEYVWPGSFLEDFIEYVTS